MLITKFVMAEKQNSSIFTIGLALLGLMYEYETVYSRGEFSSK